MRSSGPRVLYIIDSLTRSGAEQSLVSMAPHLLRRGIDLEVAYLVERPGLLNELRATGVETHAITQARSRPARVRALRSLIGARRPDLVHTTLFESDVAGRVAARLAGVPSVSSLVNVAYGYEQRRDHSLNPAKLRAALFADRLTAKLPVLFHAITEHVATRMAAKLRVPRDHIEVIPRGRDRDSLGFASSERRNAVRASVGLPSNGVVLLAAARHEYQKGLDVLIEAMPLILAETPDAVLLIAGRTGKQTQILNERITALGLDRAVRLLGVRDDVPDLVVASDVFVLPSRWEGFGGVLVEAMALNTPVVAADLPPLREVAAETVEYCEPEDADLLARSVISVLDDHDGARARAASAAQRYEAKFTISRVAEAMSAFYSRALEDRSTL
jgi:glycosyltransferase involved in cell wall biosynthesis